ncbi:MAG: isocitrate lyase/PEP mutase family protein, partial [Deltaproteobacteria bacterium]
MNKAGTLRTLLSRDRILPAPGVYNALTAKVAQYCQFECAYMTGYGTAASFGYPDIGLLTMTEMLDNLRRINDAIEIPLLVDADTGYGNEINVYRTVREYERAGAAAIQLEDQTWPKRCGHMEGKHVIEAEDMVRKIRAAVDARVNPDTVLIIRTDALATHGFEAAVSRGNLYVEAGADILFIEAPTSIEQMREIPRLFS